MEVVVVEDSVDLVDDAAAFFLFFAAAWLTLFKKQAMTIKLITRLNIMSER